MLTLFFKTESRRFEPTSVPSDVISLINSSTITVNYLFTVCLYNRMLLASAALAYTGKTSSSCDVSVGIRHLEKSLE